MATPQRVGLIGVGLMGHGIGKNILAKGHALNVLAHRNRGPVDDLVSKGGKELKSPRDVAAASDLVITVVGNSTQLEDIVFREDGILAGVHKGTVMADCTTAMPDSTLKIAAAIKGKGARFVDIPMSRTPKEAEAGKLCLMTGGDPATLAEIRPVLDCFADLIVHCGDISAGHRVKLVNNMLSLGYGMVTAEALLAAKKGGIDLKALRDVVSGGGANSVMFQRLAAYAIENDNTQLRFAIANAAKDVRYFTHMCESLPVATPVAQAIHQAYAMAANMGYAEQYVPTMVDILGEWNEKNK
ncbi:MAG TPA: NAD(P)-dependent oxidoreductase [Dongiaceae bacterium]|jgi:3-hydroxyisobutyrate dehydrogenase-like beta-hydroxyacid dehydrogenase|nr:NAD(P)-dependent oxidoreductase [Dongiaceae bacterium]